MPELSKDVIALLSFLLPGFLVAWVLYALTSHQKPVQFERVIQALVFTLFVKVFVIAEKTGLEYIGRWWSFGAWGENSELLASLITALIIGFLIAFVTNREGMHQFLRDKGLVSRSGHPSEWYGVFCGHPLFVVVHFKDERRLYGWPKVWSSDPEKGHIFITKPMWLTDVENHDLVGTKGVLVDVREVKWVEFMNEPEQSDDK